MQLNPQDVQLLFVHLQPGVVQSSLTEDPRTIERGATALMKGASMFGIPASFALVPEEGCSAAPVDGLRPYASLENSFVGAFGNAWLDERLRARIEATSRRTIILAGFSADVGVLHIGLSALQAGFRVLVPVDTTGCRSARAEQAALAMIRHKGGEVTGAASVLAALGPDFSREPGSTMLSLISEVNARDDGQR